MLRMCPACGREMEFKDIKKLTIKRKPPLPPVEQSICMECYNTTSNVLRLIHAYRPEQLIFVENNSENNSK